MNSPNNLAYLKQLSNNAASTNPAQWSQVQLAHDNWNYSQSGLTPAGAALLSIAVAAYAPGLSSGLTSSITTATSASVATALNAGFVALQAQTAVAMVNNGGDIGKTLQQLGSEQSVKNLLITMATAGALDKLNSTYFADGKTATSPTLSGQGIDGAGSASSAGSIANNGLNTAQATNAFQQNLLKNVTNNIAGSAIDAAISGKAFDEKTLSTALSNALITAGMAQGANSIGDAKLNTFTSSVAHAALGCVSGAVIAGNGGGCSAGAVGAVVGELSSSYALDRGMSDKDAAAFAKVMAATSGLLAGGGGDNAAAVNIANTTGANAAEYNRLLHKSDQQAAAQLANQLAQSGLKKADGSTYTLQDIQAQMRLMGNTQYNEAPNMTATLMGFDSNPTNGGIPAVNQLQSANPQGSSLQDPNVPKQYAGGSTAATVVFNEVPAQADMALQQYIIANTGGANSVYAVSDGKRNAVTTSNRPPESSTTSTNMTPTGANDVAGMPSGKPNPPDYVTVQGGAFGVGTGMSVNLINGEVFVGGNKSNLSPGVGGSITLGRMLDAPPTDTSRGDAVSNMLGGASAQSAICVGGLCAGVNQSIAKPGERPTALEVGVGTPGVNAGVGASFPVPGTKK